MSFLEKLKDVYNVTQTLNGAETFVSTKSAILNLYSLGGASRLTSVNTLQRLVIAALDEDPRLAAKVIFYLGDIRQGQGERAVFKVALDILLTYFDNKQLLQYLPEFSRWDILISLFNTNKVARKIVRKEFLLGTNALFFKWLPSHRGHKVTSSLARDIRNSVGFTEEQYRKYVKERRASLNLVETNLTCKQYVKIDYNKVPSLAGVKYRKAFYRHDEERYTAHVNEALSQAKKVLSGEMKQSEVTTKVNASVLYPHDVIKSYLSRSRFDVSVEGSLDEAVEAAWYSLPNYLTTDNSAGVLPIIDTSGSMASLISKDSRVQSIDVALGFGIYFAERLKGEFKNHFINFSSESKLNKLSGNSLYQKLQSIDYSDWGGSTNIQAAFDKILQVAVKNKLKQEDLPSTLLIFSDMEFNYCGENTNLVEAKRKFALHGYVLPDVVFWRVNSLSTQVPATMDNSGVVLVSGYSPVVIKFITTGEITTPYDLMLKTVNTPRYGFIDTLTLK